MRDGVLLSLLLQCLPCFRLRLEHQHVVDHEQPETQDKGQQDVALVVLFHWDQALAGELGPAAGAGATSSEMKRRRRLINAFSISSSKRGQAAAPVSCRAIST